MAATQKGPLPGGYGAKKPKTDKGGGNDPIMDLYNLLFPPEAAMGGGTTTAQKLPAAGGPGQGPPMMAQPTDTVQATEVAPRDFWGTGEGINMDAMGTVPPRNPAFASDAAAFGPQFNQIETGLPPVGQPMPTIPPMPSPAPGPGGMMGTPPAPGRNPAFSGAGDPMEQALLALLNSMGAVPEKNPALHPQPGEELGQFFGSFSGGV